MSGHPRTDKIGTVRLIKGDGIRAHLYVLLAEPAYEPWHIVHSDGDQQLSGWQSHSDMEGSEVVGYLPITECGSPSASREGVQR